jgi:hypothetical protein
MSEPIESRLSGLDTITDAQKQSIGTGLLNNVKAAIALDKLEGRSSEYWVFKADGSAEIIDEDGSAPDYVFIMPHEEEEERTRSFRVIVKKSGITGDNYTEDYKVAFLKNTEYVDTVVKAVVTAEDIDAVQEVSGLEKSEATLGAYVFALTDMIIPSAVQAAEINAAGIEAQWALGEASSAEGDYLARVLQHIEPGSSMIDVILGKN